MLKVSQMYKGLANAAIVFGKHRQKILCPNNTIYCSSDKNGFR
jgi:hypothetical protein